MTEVKVSEWKCDECGVIYESRSECRSCEEEHQADSIATTGSQVWIDIGGPGAPSMMGGQSFGHEPEYVQVKVIRREKRDEKWFVLAELSDGERQWVSGHELRQILAEKNYKQPPFDPNASACTIVIS